MLLLPLPQRRLGIWAYSLIVLASVLFWFASLSDCSRAAFQYHGLPTTEVRLGVLGAAAVQAKYGRCS
jgi:hypothetical protein